LPIKENIRMRFRFIAALIGCALCTVLTTADVRAAGGTFDAESVSAKGTVTMINLESHACPACRRMVPVLEAIGKRFEGRVSVILIDVDKDPGQLDRFKTEYVPLQVFFNAEGKEVYRHVGFMPEEDIVAQLRKMGVE